MAEERVQIGQDSLPLQRLSASTGGRSGRPSPCPGSRIAPRPVETSGWALGRGVQTVWEQTDGAMRYN